MYPRFAGSLQAHFQERLHPTKQGAFVRFRKEEEFLWKHIQTFAGGDVSTGSRFGVAVSHREIASSADLYRLWQHALLVRSIPKTYSDIVPSPIIHRSSRTPDYCSIKSRELETAAPASRCEWLSSLSGVVQTIGRLSGAFFRPCSDGCEDRAMAAVRHAATANLLASPNQL
ncbi:MAG TPA: hypothetical protein V6D17_21910 [Candidatus Obscuribacterales bacterium]